MQVLKADQRMEDQIIHIKCGDDIFFYAARFLGVAFESTRNYLEDKAIVEEIKDSQEYTSLLILALLMKKFGEEFTMLVESRYVDKYYRDSYYIHYSSKHFPYPRDCYRLSFFSGIIAPLMLIGYSKGRKNRIRNTKILQDAFIGSVVVKPLMEGKIGRTILAPHKLEMPRSCVRGTTYKLTIRGMRLRVHYAFPYSMQDGETATCAETALLNLMDYHGSHFGEYKMINPNEIIRIAQANGFERALPSKGLSVPVLSKALVDMGFFPRIYDRDIFSPPNDPQSQHIFKSLFHYYVESGIPVLMAMMNTNEDDEEGHVSICIGRSFEYNNDLDDVAIMLDDLCIVDSAQLYDNYVVMDDNQSPYELRAFDELSIHSDLIPTSFIVPLYKRMFLEASHARDIALAVMASNDVGIKKIIEAHSLVLGCSKENPLVFRLFLAASRSYKCHKAENAQSVAVASAYLNTPFPRFVWVCELYTKEGFKNMQSIGEIVIDGTASSQSGFGSVILINYPYQVVARQPEYGTSFFIHAFRFPNLYRTPWNESGGYTHNLETVPN